MKYVISDEILGDPSLKIDGENEDKQVANIISDLINLDLNKTLYFIGKFGIENILNNPSLMGITREEEVLIKELKILIKFGDNNYETV